MTQAMNEVVDRIIIVLNEIDIDGETMHRILKETGMEYQMLKQLMLTSNIIHVKDFYREAIDQESDEYLKDRLKLLV
jgi:hypothetical protein